jgi:hypothetical protein
MRWTPAASTHTNASVSAATSLPDLVIVIVIVIVF